MNKLLEVIEKIVNDDNYKDYIEAIEAIKSIVIANDPIGSLDIANLSEESKEILKLLKSEKWPEALAPHQICSDFEEDKTDRADGVVDYLGKIVNLNVLDFGCGEGHVAQRISKQAKKSIGYDVAKSGNLEWENDSSNLLLTSDINKVVSNGPYDLIVLHDVLDHSEDPVAILKQVASLCRQDTRVFVRCHGWMSRHGSHLYKILNKAWIHVFLNEEELKALGLVPDIKQKYFFPVKTQTEWFERAGFKIITSDIIRSKVEPFFRQPLLAARVTTETFKFQFPEFQLSQSLNDYFLELAK